MSTNDLVTAPVPGLIRRLAVPVSIGFFFNTMFNVVDTFYAGQFDTAALAALSLSFPVFFILIATGSGFSTGATALMGQALGSGDRREAALVGAQSIILGMLLALIIMVAGYFAAPSLFRLLGATDAVSVDGIVEVIRETFAAKPGVVDININALHRGHDIGAACTVGV